MLLSEYIAKFFAQLGVRHAFVISGGASIHLLHAFHNNPDITPISPHHEQAAAMAADGYARATGNLGLAVGTSGPGAMNMITGIGGAWFDSVPCIFLTGQVTTFRLKGDAGVRQFGFQETEILPMVEPITKYCVQIRDPLQIRYELEKAIHLAQTGRPGPVLIDIPDDLQRLDINIDDLQGFEVPAQEKKTAPSENELQQVLELINNAKRPVLIFGWGIHLAKSAKQALALAEQWEMPVLTSWAAKDIVEANHKLSAGTFGTHGTRAGNFTVQNADLIIAIGTRLSTRETGSPLTSWAREAKVVVVDIDASELEKFASFGRPLDVPICADAGVAIDRFSQLGEIGNPDWNDWQAKIEHWGKTYPVCPAENHESKHVDPYVLMELLSEVSPNECRIYSDTGCAVAWLMQSYLQKAGQRLFHDFNNTAMGWGLPAAIGGALALPGTPVICLVGDGSLMMNLQELATLRQHNLQVSIILLDNQGYSMVRQTEEQWLSGLNVGTSRESGLLFPDYHDLAKSFDIPYLMVHSPEELKNGLVKTFSTDGPSFLHIQIPSHCRVLPQVTFGYAIEDSEPHLPREEFFENMMVEIHPKSLEEISPDRMVKSSKS